MNGKLERQAKLADRLSELTLSKKIIWDLDDFEDVLSCDFSSYKVVIFESRSSDGTPSISVKIKSLRGADIDSFTDDNLVEIRPDNLSFDSYWRLLSNLVETARRQATGADDAIDSILKDLDEKDVPF